MRSQAIEDYSVYSIHLSPESITSSKIATQSVDLAHLNFTPVQGITDRPLMQQFGILPFVFPEGESMIDITVPLQTPYMDHSYVMVVSCSDPIFHAGVRSCNELQGIVGITRPEGSNCAAGYLSWIAIGGQ
ncbi:WIAG-tail domain [Paenibacillus sp. JCM 10914]|uniref:WIAG-tail domain n=1 Tax=Paenibacillus sp. JCM 10914 TaxID=1236974 RepID=UPI001E50E93E|nr:WIAG-tail domain [Paenibacillus sp. JCM 10914]